VRLVRNYGTAESTSQKTFGYSGYQLPGLTDGASGVYPLDNALNSGAEMLVLEGGINDIITGGVSDATLVTRFTSYWTKAVSTGLPVIAFNCTPYGGGATAAASMTNGNTYEIYTAGTTTWTSFGAADNNIGTVFVKSGSAGTGTGFALDKSSVTATTRKDNIATANASLAVIATSLGVTLIDTHALATMSGGFATTESLWDGIHPTPAYAHRLAVAINTQITSSYAARPPATIVPPSSSAVWVTTNNSPSQATIPTGWAKAGSAFADTWSAQTDADGTTWQRIRVVPSVANTAGSIYIRGNTGLKEGERVRFACRLRPVSGTHTLRDITILGRVSGSNASFVNFRAISQGSNLGTGNFNPITGLFISPEFTVPPFVTSLNATSMVAGKQYEILTVGTTDFTLVGAVNNTVGTRFIATAAGTGTGTVINPVITDPVFIDAYIDFTATDVTYDIRQFGVFKVISNE
jgi:lysophospholipase L1-like esterase